MIKNLNQLFIKKHNNFYLQMFIKTYTIIKKYLLYFNGN